MPRMAEPGRVETAIVGAGIAGVAVAWQLGKAGLRNVLLIDRQQPLSFTTAKSGENFRVYWPQPAMAALAARSIELMKSLATDPARIGLKFSGYQFVSEHPDRELFPAPAVIASAWQREIDKAVIRRQYPYLAGSISQVLTITQAGVVDVQALGQGMLERARHDGVRLLRGEVTSISQAARGFRLAVTGHGTDTPVDAETVVLAAGPFNSALARRLGLDLPVLNFLQRKFVVSDRDNVIPPDMPFTILADAQRLDWSPREAELLKDDPGLAWLLDELPPGLHIKPEPGGRIKLGWAYNRVPEQPSLDPQPDDLFPEIVMRGASRFIPGLKAYVERMPTPVVSWAGYYTRTADNLPLIGPLGPPGLYTVAALSGYGTMMASAAGELCAAHLTGASLPGYARTFHPNRYADPSIMAEIAAVPGDGQL